MKLWIGDLRKDPKFAMLSAESKGVWLLIIGAMHESKTYELVGTTREVAKQAQVENDEMERSLLEIEKYGVAEIVRDTLGLVSIVSRRRLKDNESTAYERERKKKYRNSLKENVTKNDCPLNVPLFDSDSDSVNYVVKDKSASKFKIPELEEVQEYFIEKGSEKSEASAFINFYDSKGWMVGKNKMKNWKASASGWISRNKKDKNERPLTARQLAGTSIKEQLRRGGFAQGEEPSDEGRAAGLAIESLYRRKRTPIEGEDPSIDSGHVQPPLLEQRTGSD